MSTWDEITGRHRLASLPDGETSGGTWENHRMLVLAELQRLRERDSATSRKLQEISGLLTALRVDIARMQVKAGVWGAVAGIIPVTLALVFFMMKGSG